MQWSPRGDKVAACFSDNTVSYQTIRFVIRQYGELSDDMLLTKAVSQRTCKDFTYHSLIQRRTQRGKMDS